MSASPSHSICRPQRQARRRVWALLKAPEQFSHVSVTPAPRHTRHPLGSCASSFFLLPHHVTIRNVTEHLIGSAWGGARLRASYQLCAEVMLERTQLSCTRVHTSLRAQSDAERGPRSRGRRRRAPSSAPHTHSTGPHEQLPLKTPQNWLVTPTRLRTRRTRQGPQGNG